MEAGARMVIVDGPAKTKFTFLLAHGADGAMDTPFLTTVAQGLGERGIRVVRFEFPYMARRREGKKSGGPDRQPVLLDAWRELIDEYGAKSFIGGKSMGGRMASMIADEKKVKGLICFGYPFHPPGKPQQLRTAHLEELKTRALILQGTRDPFGTEEEVAGYTLSPSIRMEWIPDGDHSFKPRVSSGLTERGNLDRAIEAAADFIRSSI